METRHSSLNHSDGSSQAVAQAVTDGLAVTRPEHGTVGVFLFGLVNERIGGDNRPKI
jgi:hypothetical protein